MKTIWCSRPSGSACSGTTTPFGTISNPGPSQRSADSAAIRETAIRCVDPVEQEAPHRQPAAHPAEVAGRVPGARRSGSARTRASATQIAGVIGSCRWTTSKRSSRERLADRGRSRAARGRCSAASRSPGTTTERPTGMIPAGRSPWRPVRGWSRRVSVPGGSWPIRIFTSWPRSRSAAAWFSACSTTPPQYDHENGTTMPIFTRTAAASTGASRSMPSSSTSSVTASERRAQPAPLGPKPSPGRERDALLGEQPLRRQARRAAAARRRRCPRRPAARAAPPTSRSRRRS